MKPHRRRQLKGSVLQMLSANQVWAIHEPAMAGLLGSLALGGQLSRSIFAAAIGIQDSLPTATKMMGDVAVLPITGIITPRSTWMTRALGWTTCDLFERDFAEAVGNTTAKSILLFCDSPGGVAMAIEEASQIIFAARGKKPIFAFSPGLCASGCYWLAAAADQVYASPSALIGSIGAVNTHLEYSKALADMGVAAKVFRSVPRKQLGNPYEKLTSDAESILQKHVDDCGAQFETAVAKYRGLTRAEVQKKYGLGDYFLAGEAAERGLIGAVLSWEAMLAKAQGSAGQGTGNRVEVLDRSAPPIVINAEASALPASVSAGATFSNLPSAAAAAPLGEHSMKVSARMRAALFARGFISTQDADDNACLAAISTFFAVRGEACPQEEEKVVSALMTQSPAAAAAAAPPAAPVPAGATPPPNNVQAAHDREVAEARAAAITGDRQRRKAIEASGKLLNLPAATIEAAVEGNQTHEQIIAAWHTELGAKEKPISSPAANVRVGQEGIERYVADASIAALAHYGREVPEAQLTPEIRRLSNAPLAFHAEKCLQAAGVRYDEYDKEDIVRRAMAMDGLDSEVIRADGGVPLSRPGSFPNLLSSIFGKILDEGTELAETSYEEWTAVKPGDLPDFKAVPVVAKGKYGELDEVLDADEFKEQKLNEECLSMMQLARYGNAFALTPVLAANDDLEAFIEDLIGLSEGWELRQNRGCLNLITANATLLDGYALFDDTNHLNHIGSGGAPPSDSEWDLMEVKQSKQTTIGNTGYTRASLSHCLVPPKLWRPSVQAFGKFRNEEAKAAAVDSNLSVYRGLVTIVKEPELAAVSELEWYGFSTPTRPSTATVVRAYFRGFPRKGKRERWYDPAKKCTWFSLEGRAGFAVRNYRYVVKDKGAA